MNSKGRWFQSVLVLLSLSLVAVSSAAEKPSTPPKKPTIDKRIQAAPKKPFINQKLMAVDEDTPKKKMLLVAPRGPMSAGQGIEARLQRLEMKLDAVMRELQQLRRELRTRPPMPGMMPPGPKPGMRDFDGPDLDAHGRQPHGPHRGPGAGSHPPRQPGGTTGPPAKDFHGGPGKPHPKGGPPPGFGGESKAATPSKAKTAAGRPKA